MRLRRAFFCAFVAACLSFPDGTHALAGDAPESVDAYFGGQKQHTVTEYRDELGQTVYSITASHADVSPPLSQLAAAADLQRVTENELRAEAPLPARRPVRSDLPDAVVQSTIPPVGSFPPGRFPLAAPAMGFNFEGVGDIRGSPSDSNGSVGNDQFVETANVRFQAWSLDRSASTIFPGRR